MIETVDILKILLPATVSFIIGLSITPILAHYLYKYKMWKKESVALTLDGRPATLSRELHRDEEKRTPRMGGVLIWSSILFTTLLFAGLPYFIPAPMFFKLNFLSNNQTVLPLFTLIAASLVGLADDVLQVFGRGRYIAGGLALRERIPLVLLIGLCGAYWFYVKLDYSTLIIPFMGEFDLGIFFIPFFMLIMLSLFSGGVIDGIDGLAGGIMASIFASYAGIAFFNNQIDIAAFSSVATGAILAFLWFNIPPARFYMSETGMMGLTATLSVIAFLTHAVIPLFIIALPLYAASFSVIVQLLSKRFRNGKKVFLIAPLHHHFQALGWPGYKVTMRFWVVSVICAILGMILALIA